MLGVNLANAGAATIAPEAWIAYKSRFVLADGRVVDDANGGISHSEGQGYGMLLAYLSDSRADFELIWAFTRREMMLRDDGLAVWKWDPAKTPHVSDANNATDGDILIAYALALAGKRWGAADFTDAARSLVEAIASEAVVETQGRTLLLPGAHGFSSEDRPKDGPVVNPSYWIYEAFPVFAGLDPTGKWETVYRDGIKILRESRSGPQNMPPDWVSLGTRAEPAAGFAPEYGYNAIRIPLYLIRAGVKDMPLVGGLGKGMVEGAETVTRDVTTGKAKDRLMDAGYRIIPALVACLVDGRAVPPELLSFVPTNYYPSTLHLLSLSYLAERTEACG